MARSRKEYKALNINLRADIWDRLDAFSQNWGQSKTVAVEKALSQYLDKMEAVSLEDN